MGCPRHCLKRTLTLPLLALTLACRTQPELDERMGNAPTPETQPVAEPAPEPAPPRSVAVARAVPHAALMREVFLDPRGEAALTLDVHGGVRLWPTLTSDDPRALEPFAIPVDEPLAMSLARQSGGAFTLAFIDNSNAARVMTLERRGDAQVGAGAGAELVERFVIPPDDPQLEIHVLDGGERILTLGVDHRVRLFDATGKLLSQLDERSFAPWQLRVVGGVGEPPKLLAVLAQPPRVQALALDHDVLSVRGEARQVELDRGPNLNDLELSSDGRSVFTLRRPRAKGRGWSIEVIDLETDARKLLAGRADTLVRPRMHVVDAARILLESGSGKGFWIPLASAVPLEQPTDAHPDSRFAEQLAKRSQYDRVKLPVSSEDIDALPDGDIGVRMHASIRNGVRAAIDPRGGPLVVHDIGALADPVAAFDYRNIEHLEVNLSHGALAPDGSLVAWVDGNTLYVQALDGDAAGEPRSFTHAVRDVFALAVVDPDHAVIVGKRSAVSLSLSTGEVTSSAKVELGWTATGLDMQQREHVWQLIYRDDKPSAPLRVLEYRDAALVDVRVASTQEHPYWASGAKPADADEWVARGDLQIYTVDSARTRLHVQRGAEQRVLELAAGQGRELSLSPDATLVALVQFRAREPDRSRRSRDNHDLIVSVIDVASGERLWTRAVMLQDRLTLAWSGDARRLATICAGIGTVYDARSGEQLTALHHLPVTLDIGSTGN